MSLRLRIEHPGQFADVVPHLLGFTPTESLIVIPLTPDLPVARIDLPGEDGISVKKLRTYCASILPPYLRYATPRSEAVIAVISDRRPLAEHVAAFVGHELECISVAVRSRVWSDGVQWHEALTDEVGSHSIDDATRYAAERAFAGAALPSKDRVALNQSLTGDRTQLDQDISRARREAATHDRGEATDWAARRVREFHRDGVRLSGPDAARLLVALEDRLTRDAIWISMTPGNASSHKSLLSDLVRRAPDTVRTPAAALLGFASWLTGDGATAWCALDQIPSLQRDSYVLADVVAATLTEGIRPADWAGLRAGLTANDSTPGGTSRVFEFSRDRSPALTQHEKTHNRPSHPER